MTDKKKVIVLDHGGGRLANQLWTDAAIYAYAAEKGYEFESWASFEYHKYFTIPPIKNWFVRTAFFNPLVAGIKNPFWRKWIVRKIIKKILYRFFSEIIRIFNKGCVIYPGAENFFFPPSQFSNQENLAVLNSVERLKSKNIYFYGYGFRNPEGLQKYRQQVLSRFSPREGLQKMPTETIQNLRAKFKHVIGVHFRQGDYRTVPSHSIWRYTEEEIRKFLDSYFSWSKNLPEETVFAMSSDEAVNLEKFTGLNVVPLNGNEMEDLISLSLTDLIIGSKSTYGDFAAYYGDIPFVVFERNGIEWDYYNNRKNYFENKKSHLNSDLKMD